MQDNHKQNIKSLSADDRPREKMLNKGTAALSNAELLAILLGSGTRDLNAVQLAQLILRDNQDDLNLLAKKSPKEMTAYPGVGPAKAVTITAALELGRRRRANKNAQQAFVRDSHTAYELLSPHLADLLKEEFWVLYLNNQNKLILKKKISEGGIAGTVVDSRLIFKDALLHNATKMILAHNHPSGNLKPSKADISLTKKLIAAGETMDIRIVDHLIVTQDDYTSIFSFEGLD